MQWSSINDLLVTASSDASIRIWQISNGKCMRVIENIPGIENLCCCFPGSITWEGGPKISRIALEGRKFL